MEAQRERARAASQFGVEQTAGLAVAGKTEFSGYDRLEESEEVAALFMNGQPAQELREGEEGVVVLKRTPFYGESGGQVGDTGHLIGAAGEFHVTDTKKQGDGVHTHIGRVSRGRLRVGDSLSARVDKTKRQATALNHSATHLLHAALRQVLGPHVTQKGSLVDAQRLRFDFSHYEPVTVEQLQAIERLVNAQIRGNAPVETQVMAMDAAIDAGASAVFGEKYGERVRVLRMGEFSTELWGGTHVHRLGDVGLFKITAESGIAAGVRRIEGVTGEAALDYVSQIQNRLRQAAQLVRGDRDNPAEKIQQLVERSRRQEKEIEQLKQRLASGQGGDLADQAIEVAGIKVLAARLDGADVKTLRGAGDRLKDKLKAAAVVLAAVEDGKVRLIAGVTSAQTARIKAGDLVNAVARQVGGKGGGRPDMAQAGGSDPSRLDAALQSVPEWVREALG